MIMKIGHDHVRLHLNVSKLHGNPLSSPSTTKPSQHHLKQFIIAGIQKTIINTVIIIEVYEY